MRRIRNIYGDSSVEEGDYTLSYNADVKLFRLSNFIEAWFALYDPSESLCVSFSNGVQVELEPHFDETAAMVPVKFVLAHTNPDHAAPNTIGPNAIGPNTIGKDNEPTGMCSHEIKCGTILNSTLPIAGVNDVSVETPHSARRAEEEIKTCLKKLERAVTLLSAARGHGDLSVFNHEQELKH